MAKKSDSTAPVEPEREEGMSWKPAPTEEDMSLEEAWETPTLEEIIQMDLRADAECRAGARRTYELARAMGIGRPLGGELVLQVPNAGDEALEDLYVAPGDHIAQNEVTRMGQCLLRIVRLGARIDAQLYVDQVTARGGAGLFGYAWEDKVRKVHTLLLCWKQGQKRAEWQGSQGVREK